MRLWIFPLLAFICFVGAEKRLIRINQAEKYEGKLEPARNNQNRIAKQKLMNVQRRLEINDRYQKAKTRHQIDLVRKGLQLTTLLLKEGGMVEIDKNYRLVNNIDK